MNNRNSGFALVIALSLMAFVLLLLLSITTMVQVESRNAGTTLDQLEARANAQLAAMVALGDLQKYAGPDQRVTARADVLLKPSELDPTFATSAKGYEFWTGIWSSRLDANGDPLNDQLDLDVQLDAHRPQWLVSGDISSFVDSQNKPHSDIQGNNTIKLASKDRAVVHSGQEVVVPKEQIKGAGDAVVGEYAFWVSDEGVKARVNLGDAFEGSLETGVPYYQAALAQQGDASGVKLVNTADDRPYEESESIWKAPTSPVAKVASSAELPLIKTGLDSEALTREFFHDFTVSSRSLLTNTKDAGLKRDLSVALNDLSTSGLTGPMFAPVGGSESPGNPGGPKWEQLAHYYSICWDEWLASGGNPAQVNFQMPTEDQVGITPIMTRFNLVFQVFSERFNPLPTTDPKDQLKDYDFTLGVFPLITLWNPYDVDMVLPDIGIQTDIRPMQINEGEPDAWKRSDSTIVEALAITDKNDYPKYPNQGGNWRRVVQFKIKGVTIPAGRAMSFTPPVNSFYDENDPSNNVLVPGASDTQIRGFFSPKVRDETSTIDYTVNGDVDGDVNLYLDMASISNPGQVVNLYTEPSNLDSEGRFQAENEFMSVTNLGMLELYSERAKGRKVIRFEDMDATAGMGMIMAAGASALASLDEGTPINIDKIETLANAISGSANNMTFPLSAREDDAVGIHLLSQMNPRSPLITDNIHARWHSNHGYASEYAYRLLGPGYEASRTDAVEKFISGADDEFSYVGVSHDSNDGNDQMVLFEAPARPVLSLGQLMHANLSNIDLIHDIHLVGAGQNLQQPQTYPAYAIGNSFANIHLPLDSTRIDITNSSGMFSKDVTIKGGWAGAHYDYSYELNDALWDDFYFSTILPDQLNNVSFPLPNSRMVRWDESAPVETGDDTHVAANLILEGGFNINSTSVAAWESVLGALRNVPTLGKQPATTDLKHNFSRFTNPLLESTELLPSYTTTKSDNLVAGFRSLTDDQISSLAKEIVDEIRLRRSPTGRPFLSLSEFVNRSIDRADIEGLNGRLTRFAHVGTMQRAIESSAVNGDVSSETGLWEKKDDFVTRDISSLSIEPFFDNVLELVKDRPFLDSAPGALTQADVLAKIGAILTPRSDTFTIRAYGNSTEQVTNQVKASSYYEIVVQRSPEYVDDRDDPYTDSLSLRDLNKKFGRKFEILSTRFVDVEEI